MVFMVGALNEYLLTNEATLPTFTCSAITKILSTKCLDIAEPRIFCPPKITVVWTHSPGTVWKVMFG